MKNLKYLFFIIPFLFFSNVKAETVNVTQYSYNNLGTYGGMYYGYADDSQSQSNYSFGTRYQYKLNQAYFDIRYTLPSSSTITFTLNAADDDLRNTIAIYNVYDVTNQQYLNVSNFRFVSMRKVQLDFTTYNSTNEVRILLSSSSYYNYITGVSNWNFTSITYDIPDNTPSSDTQNIIDNQNQNTTDIIDNQNQNTQEQIESQKVCQVYDSKQATTNGYLTGAGVVSTSVSGYGTSGFIPIDSTSELKVLSNIDTDNRRVCWYNTNQNFLSCTNMNTIPVGTVLNIPTDARYFRYSLYKFTNVPTYSLCKNGNQALTDTLTDSNVSNDTGTSFFDNFTDNDYGLSQIITIPLNTIQSLTSKTCTSLQVPIPFTNSNVSLPCMTDIYEDNFSSIYALWKTVSFGIVAYLISIDIFHIVKGFKDPESDKVEVLDL